MLDYQFLGLVAVVLALVSRGSLLPVVTVTLMIGLVTLACEAGTRAYRRRHPHRSPDAGPVRTPVPGARRPSDRELNRWMAAVERVLRSAD
jgi:hypothetical protein